MGIQGLLPLLKSIMSPIHVKEFSGQSVAVDTYSWLHKGALSCSRELCNGDKTSRHIDYCMHRVNLLRHHGVRPILVFDGGLLPMKSDQEAKRLRSRKENLERAIQHESSGNFSAAYECYQKAVDISPSIAAELIEVLKQENVTYVVAPYEADAQMTFLLLKKHVVAVITEDSDLIPFGCSRIIFKMDKFGQGVEFQYSMLARNMDLNFTGFTKQMILEMCIFSGCDYLQSLSGMGLKKAHALVRKFKTYEKVIKHLRYSVVSVPPLYEENFKKAMWTFLYQRVYDPVTEDIVHLTDFPFDLDYNLDFLGPSMPQSVVKGIAKGDLDPFTKMPFQETICVRHVLRGTYQVKEFQPESQKKKLDLPAQKNVLTNYFCLASVEAKRKFKAPRIMPKDSDSSPGIEDGVSDFSCLAMEPAACTMNHSQRSLLELGNFGRSFPLKGYHEEDFAPNDDRALDLQKYERLNGDNGVPENLNCLEPSVSFKHEIFKQLPASQMTSEFESDSDEHTKKASEVQRKVIVRSRFFQDMKGHEEPNEKHVTERNVNCNLESAALGNKCPESALHNGIPKVKRKHTGTILTGKSKHTPGLRTKHMDMEPQPKNFGCNISHLNHYSDIAEKSMERFVSIVSSFRCVTPGSRASGLRPPLKDVRNTCADGRSSGMPDCFSKFTYVPNNQKTIAATIDE